MDFNMYCEIFDDTNLLSFPTRERDLATKLHQDNDPKHISEKFLLIPAF